MSKINNELQSIQNDLQYLESTHAAFFQVVNNRKKVLIFVRRDVHRDWVQSSNANNIQDHFFKNYKCIVKSSLESKLDPVSGHVVISFEIRKAA